jgi:hypothetical protein
MSHISEIVISQTSAIRLLMIVGLEEGHNDKELRKPLKLNRHASKERIAEETGCYRIGCG